MAHELRGIEHQSAEFYQQLFMAGAVFAVVVIAFACYLHRKHEHLLKRPPPSKGGAAQVPREAPRANRFIVWRHALKVAYRLSLRHGLALTTLILALPTYAELVDVRWDTQGAFERTLQIEPGKMVEVCSRLTNGQKVAWSFKSATSLNFNVHYHEGKKVVFPEKQDGVAQRQGELKVPVDQDYCWMWSNKSGAAATLSVQWQRKD